MWLSFLFYLYPCFKTVQRLKVKPRVKPKFTMNTGINILCYKSKTLANGEHPLMFRVCKDGKKKYVSLGVSVAPQYWDFQKNKPKRNCPDRILIEKLIAQKSKELSELVLELEADNKEYTAATLVEKAVKPKVKATVGSLMKEHIKDLKEANRTGYALSMEQVYNSLIKFNGHLDMPFSDIDIQWLKKYEQWLRNRGLAENTIGIRFRTLRRIYNIALERKLVKSEDYPFKSFGVSRLHQQTAKRSIKKEGIYRILNYPTDNKRYYYSLAIDLFKFSYFTGGINFADMAYITKKNIMDGRLVYCRKKTKKIINLPLQAEALEVLEKYRSDSEYLFPIFSAFHKTEQQKRNRLHKVITKVNDALKEIGKELGITIDLTTYVARHSYATVLKRSGVSTAIISESLGHSSEKVTQIYLDSFENSQIDEAMKNLL